jgi:transposase InsO family protein
VYLFGNNSLSTRTSHRMTRWAMYLSQFSAEFRYRPGVIHGIADAMSRLTSTGNEQELVAPLEGAEAEQCTDSANQWDIEINRLWKDALESCPDYREQASQESTRAIGNVPFTGVQLRSQGGRIWRYTWFGQAMHRVILVPNHLPLREVICKAAHERVAHQGVTKTLGKIRETYHWRGMETTARKVVNACSLCDQMKMGPPGPCGSVSLRPIQTSRTHELVAVDLYQPGIETSGGNRYILTIIDHFSKYSRLVALPSKHAKVVARALIEEWILLFGAPEALHSDRGLEFVNRLLQDIALHLGFRLSRTTAYNPAGNGVTERMNRTITQLLRVLASENQSQWDRVLPQVMYTYNTSRHETTKLTPHSIMFGSEAPDLHSADTNQSYAGWDSTPIGPRNRTRYVQSLTKQLRFVRATAAENSIAGRSKFARAYDKRISAEAAKRPRPKWLEGMAVWLWIPRTTTDQSPKLTHFWQGPFRIEKIINEWNVIVTHQRTGEQCRTHVNRLRKCRSDEGSSEGNERGLDINASVQEQDDQLPFCVRSAYWVIHDILGRRRKGSQWEYQIRFQEPRIVAVRGRVEWLKSPMLPELVVADADVYLDPHEYVLREGGECNGIRKPGPAIHDSRQSVEV